MYLAATKAGVANTYANCTDNPFALYAGCTFTQGSLLDFAMQSRNLETIRTAAFQIFAPSTDLSSVADFIINSTKTPSVLSGSGEAGAGAQEPSTDSEDEDKGNRFKPM
jgi:hypothetical protein